VVGTGLLRGLDTRAILQHAALLGAYVATQPGAVPADQPTAAVVPPAPPARRAPGRRAAD
jgi:hypothetical protein